LQIYGNYLSKSDKWQTGYCRNFALSNKNIVEFPAVLQKRRTYRDYTDCQVSERIMFKLIDAAFKAPTNNHLRQMEFRSAFM